MKLLTLFALALFAPAHAQAQYPLATPCRVVAPQVPFRVTVQRCYDLGPVSSGAEFIIHQPCARRHIRNRDAIYFYDELYFAVLDGSTVVATSVRYQTGRYRVNGLTTTVLPGIVRTTGTQTVVASNSLAGTCGYDVTVSLAPR